MVCKLQSCPSWPLFDHSCIFFNMIIKIKLNLNDQGWVLLKVVNPNVDVNVDVLRNSHSVFKFHGFFFFIYLCVFFPVTIDNKYRNCHDFLSFFFIFLDFIYNCRNFTDYWYWFVILVYETLIPVLKYVFFLFLFFIYLFF